MAMAGDGCVALAVDKRFGSGPQMVNIAPRHVLTPHSNLMVAFTGLEGDVQSLLEELSVQVSSKMSHGSGFGFGHDVSRLISPHAMASLTSHVLYSRRRSPYYVEPLVVGLERRVVIVEEEEEERADNDGPGDEKFNTEDDVGVDRNRKEKNYEIASSSSSTTVRNESVGGGNAVSSGTDNQIIITRMKRRKKRIVRYIPYLCAQDLIGAKSLSTSFICAGVASKSMYGTAEAMWRPGMKPEELARVCGKAFLSALERDCLSGYGAMVYVMTGEDGIIEYDLASRND